MATTKNSDVTVKHHALNQCQIMVGGLRVGYVCYGENMPVNFLTRKTAGVNLTDKEKLRIATAVRELMKPLNAERDREAAELAVAINPQTTK